MHVDFTKCPFTAAINALVLHKNILIYAGEFLNPFLFRRLLNHTLVVVVGFQHPISNTEYACTNMPLNFIISLIITTQCSLSGLNYHKSCHNQSYYNNTMFIIWIELSQKLPLLEHDILIKSVNWCVM